MKPSKYFNTWRQVEREAYALRDRLGAVQNDLRRWQTFGRHSFAAWLQLRREGRMLRNQLCSQSERLRRAEQLALGAARMFDVGKHYGRECVFASHSGDARPEVPVEVRQVRKMLADYLERYPDAAKPVTTVGDADDPTQP